VNLPRLVTVEHERAGQIDLDASQLLHFSGLPGFPSARNFALAPHEGNSPFTWLACLDQLDLAFVVAEPSKLVPDYAPQLGQRELDAVGAEARDDILVLAIVNLGRGDLTLNLAAPILVNARSRRAAQVVLSDTALRLRARIGDSARIQMESNPQR
jgi:flagellar assembly factor FliW